ncbi:stress response translation initiation inhibitor YciH [Agaribacterium sp. ZY112]|uniref:stress response translation initiation inhibitor YciH n=1 Tax=Agaribacterium sp. ZY112 TaxID=3233574 RepID=UPI00352534C3
MKEKNTRLVYSTDQGRIKDKDKTTPQKTGDGIIRIRRETKGRKGKGVSCCEGFELEPKALKDLAKKLKQLCGTGGAVKDGIIEIQGDQREKLKQYLETQGFQVKLSGG